MASARLSRSGSRENSSEATGSSARVYLLPTARTPEVEQILERDAHRDVVARPAEYSDVIHYVGPVPDDDVPELVAGALEGLDNRDVDGDPRVVPPHVGDVHHAVRPGPQKG